MIAKLDAIGTSEWRTSLSRQLAEKALDLIDNGFRAKRNPYGDRWTKTKQPNPILERTGQLRSSFRIIAATPDGFLIRSDSPYGGFHQFGTGRLPVRAMVPTQAGGMSASWERVLDGVFVRFVRETMR